MDEPAGGDAKRRKLLMWTVGSLGAAGGALVISPVVGFIVGPTARRPIARWHPVGRVDDFPLGSTSMVTVGKPTDVAWAGPSGKQAVFLRRTAESEFVAFSIYCTHTACPVRWVERARLFLCPCHGGSFHADGAVAGGPPIEPLPRHEARVRDDHVEVRLTRGVLRRRG